MSPGLWVQYGHNPEKAKEYSRVDGGKLSARPRRQTSGCNKERAGGDTFLIRTEDVRKRVGDYIATLLEASGSRGPAVQTAAEAGRFGLRGDQAEGKWHLYTGGWISMLICGIKRDNFNYYYTPKGRPDTLWQA